MIEKMLNTENISVNVEVKDWVGAIKEAGSLLLKNGKIEDRYIDGMIDTVKDMGPYIVMVPGVAMPHARPEVGAKELGIAAITLKEPVNFGNEDFDPVSVIFALCAKENKEHLELLQDLSCILDDSELVDRAKECNTQEEFINIINDCYSKNI